MESSKNLRFNPVVYHLGILVASFLIVVISGTVFYGNPFGSQFIFNALVILVQVELFVWLGMRFFRNISPAVTGNKRKIVLRLVWFYLTAFTIATAILVLIISVRFLLAGLPLSDVFSHLLFKEAKGFIIGTALGFMIGAVIFFYFQWDDALKRVQKLKEEKLIFQYETLKSQVNPHFLFNSLNTLSSLVRKDPDLTERFISKLSSIYQYILENKDTGLIKLSSEIAFVEDFFFLQKIRDDGKIELNIDVEKSEDFEILPISLQLLVENALKHNVATMENPLTIDISMESEHIVVRNRQEPKSQLLPSSKVGLDNLGKRVSLTLGRELVVEDSVKEFIVKLPVQHKSDDSPDH